MTAPVNRRESSAPNEDAEPDIALLLDRVCAQLPHEYTKQLVRDVVRLKLAMGFEREVRSYLKRRSGEYPAIPAIPLPRDDA
jgi:hypothetical protein